MFGSSGDIYPTVTEVFDLRGVRKPLFSQNQRSLKMLPSPFPESAGKAAGRGKHLFAEGPRTSGRTLQMETGIPETGRKAGCVNRFFHGMNQFLVTQK